MVGDVVEQALHYGYVVSFRLSVYLQMIRGFGKILCAELDTLERKTLTDKSHASYHEDIRRYVERYNPFVQENACRVSDNDSCRAIALVSLDKLPVVIKTYLFSFAVLGSGPKMFMATNSTGPAVGDI